jgi:hypothetical protein
MESTPFIIAARRSQCVFVFDHMRRES